MNILIIVLIFLKIIQTECQKYLRCTVCKGFNKEVMHPKICSVTEDILCSSKACGIYDHGINVKDNTRDNLVLDCFTEYSDDICEMFNTVNMIMLGHDNFSDWIKVKFCEKPVCNFRLYQEANNTHPNGTRDLIDSLEDTVCLNGKWRGLVRGGLDSPFLNPFAVVAAVLVKFL